MGIHARNVIRREKVRTGEMADEEDKVTHLLVEHPIPLVDVRNVSLILVEPLPRKFVPSVLSM